MKHTTFITLILLAMYLFTQLVGIAVVGAYSPEVYQVELENGTIVNITDYNLPYGTNPPQDIGPKTSLISIIIAIIFAVFLMLLLMKINAALFLRLWFFLVVTIAIGITLNAGILNVESSSTIALIIALPLAFLKVFQRNIIVHNVTELMIYPGIAAILVPLLNIWTVVILFILLSIYDMYAVWQAKFMQKMAKYQIEQLRFFAGFFIPYMRKEDRELIAQAKKSKAKEKALKRKKIKVNVAILGGGDVVVPIILAGVVLRALGLTEAIIIAVGATVALAGLFYASEKGKFYPAMPFITAGSFIALGIAFLI